VLEEVKKGDTAEKKDEPPTPPLPDSVVNKNKAPALPEKPKQTVLVVIEPHYTPVSVDELPVLNASKLLPLGWTKGNDRDGTQMWQYNGGAWTYVDPRITHCILPSTLWTRLGPDSWKYIPSNREFKGVVDPRLILPMNWESSTSQNGKPYFISHIEKKTTYFDPRLKYVP